MCFSSKKILARLLRPHGDLLASHKPPADLVRTKAGTVVPASDLKIQSPT